MHREVLTNRAAELFPALTQFSGFYLAGGTGLALQIGHRLSVDFDLFSANGIKRSLLAKVETAFPGAPTIAPLVNNTDELTVLVNDVKLTLLKYPFPTFDPFFDCEGVPILSVREIAATKAYTIGRRGAYKDYVDLYFVLAEGRATLAEIIELAERKFGVDFNPRLFLEQIVFLDDVEDADVRILRTAVTRSDILEFLGTAAKAYAESIAPSL